MTTGGKHRRGIGNALRSLFARIPKRQASDRSVAAPDTSWQDADHQAPHARDEQIFDPWEPKIRTNADPLRPSSSDDAGKDPIFPQSTLNSESNVDGEQIG